LKICIKKKEIRGWVIIIICFNAVFCTNQLLTVLFLENPFTEEGIGISPFELSNFSFFSFFPNITLIFLASFFVNKTISGQSFIKLVIFLYMISTLMIPILKDLLVYIGER